MTNLFRSKNEQVTEFLREKIITCDIQPGAVLVIDALSKELGVSQIPIREGLRQLEADGLVVIEPYVGAHVTEINAHSIREVFDLLESMEVSSGRAACEIMTDSDIEELSQFIKQMAKQVDQPDVWCDQNRQLHLLICDMAKASLTRKLINKVLDHWDRLRHFYFQEVFIQRVHLAQAEHEAMLEAFNMRDPDILENSLRLHNRIALASYIDHMQQSGILPTA